MKTLCAILSVLLIVAIGYIFHQQRSAPPRIALLDVERVISESAPGRAGREHLAIIDRRFQLGMDELHKNYANAPVDEQQRVFSNAEETLVRQFSVEEREVSAAMKGIIQEEAEKWRQAHRVSAVFPAQLVLASDADKLDCTSDVLAAVNQRQITFAGLPELKVTQPSAGIRPAPSLRENGPVPRIFNQENSLNPQISAPESEMKPQASEREEEAEAQVSTQHNDAEPPLPVTENDAEPQIASPDSRSTGAPDAVK